MSGGHWEYKGTRIQFDLEDIANDESLKKYWPNIGRVLAFLAEWIYDTEHDMDWHLSADHFIKDNEKWEDARLLLLLTEVMKQVPDQYFPRGKWALIQYFQQMMERVESNEKQK